MFAQKQYSAHEVYTAQFPGYNKCTFMNRIGGKLRFHFESLREF